MNMMPVAKGYNGRVQSGANLADTSVAFPDIPTRLQLELLKGAALTHSGWPYRIRVIRVKIKKS